jgi:hypothetical protein
MASDNTIKRRIYTTTQNGVYLTGSDSTIVGNLIGNSTSPYMPPAQIPLWPPDPTSGILTGAFDEALGLTQGTMTQAEKLAQLKTIGACTPTSNAAPTPLGCRTGQTVATQLSTAVSEARRIILAHAAGASVRTGVFKARRAGGLQGFG